MRWFWRKLDALLGSAVAAVAALAASQLHVFIHAYLQRLGGHLDEARLAALRLAHDAQLAGADPLLRDGLRRAAETRAAELQAAMAALAEADALWRPFVFLREADPAIVRATLAAFQPALPLDTASIVSALVGLVLGWTIYDLAMTPLRSAFRRRPDGRPRGRAAR